MSQTYSLHLSPVAPRVETQTQEARFAARVVARLNEASSACTPDISERLRFAREQALATARLARARPPQRGIVASVLRALARPDDEAPWWLRSASLLPALVLIAGLILIQRESVEDNILTAATIDSQLLANTLPPAAYSDPGFAQFLKSSPEI